MQLEITQVLTNVFVYRLMITMLLAFAIQGCLRTGGSAQFVDTMELPGGGADIQSEFWEDIEPPESGNLPKAYWYRRWYFPFSFMNKEAEFEQPDQLRVSRFLYNGLGAPILFMLPVRFKSSQYVYSPDQEEPVGGDWFSWSLLWADSGVVGDGLPGRNVNAWGVPLFFGHVTTETERDSNSFWNTLWTLGPSYFSHKVKPPPEESGTGTVAPLRQLEVHAFMPATLGGLPGGLVWVNFIIRNVRGEKVNRLDAHGPLLGILGVLQSYTQEDGREEMLRLTAMGALWYDTYDRSAEGTPEFSAHGPLWSMFGWGRKNGDPAIRLFWYPLVLP